MRPLLQGREVCCDDFHALVLGTSGIVMTFVKGKLCHRVVGDDSTQPLHLNEARSWVVHFGVDLSVGRPTDHFQAFYEASVGIH